MAASFCEMEVETVMKLGISTKLLWLTLSFVMLAEVFIFLPSLVNFRRNWLNDKLTAARTASLILKNSPDNMVSASLARELVMSIGVHAIAVKNGYMRQLIADDETLPMAVMSVDLREISLFTELKQSLSTLNTNNPRMILLHGAPPKGEIFTEVLLSEQPLQAAMWVFVKNILILSLLISLFTASLVFLSLHYLLVRPLRRFTNAISLFANQPEATKSIITPSKRGDDISIAEYELQQMQKQVQQTLKTKNHLAQLGLAVAKINHDLRNMFGVMQLFSERLTSSDDKMVQKLAPLMLNSLERATNLCNDTLKFSQTSDQPLNITQFSLQNLVEEVVKTLGEVKPLVLNNVPQDLDISADEAQLFRVFMNLGRNSIEAMKDVGDTLTFSAQRQGGTVTIDILDNGAGLPAKAKAHLFEAFRGNVRSGGTGLGLAIAKEIIEAHNGTLTLQESETGAHFRMSLSH